MLRTLFLNSLEISLSVSLIVVVLLVLSPLLNKKYVAKWRYWVWLILALRLVIPLNITLPAQPIQVPVPEIVVDTSFMQQGGELQLPQVWPEGELPGSTQLSEKSGKIALLDVLAGLWVGGMLLFACWQFIGYWRFTKRIKRWRYQPVDKERFSQLFKQLQLELNLRQGIAIFICPILSSPLLIGIFKPRILLPRENYSDEELNFILKHELIHFKRHDIMYKQLLLGAKMVHWFNPLIWLMVRTAYQDVEVSCDDAVLYKLSPAQRSRYSATILATAGRRYQQTVALSTNFRGGAKVMKIRFKNIFDQQNKKRGELALAIVLGCTILLSGLVACQDNSITPVLDGPASETLEDKAWEIINRDIAMYEADPQVKILDSELTRLEKVDQFTDFLAVPLEVYALEYRLKPQDLSKVVLAGGMQLDEDGWLMQTCSAGDPYLLAAREGDNLSYLGTLWSLTIQESGGLRQAIALNLNKEISGDRIVLYPQLTANFFAELKNGHHTTVFDAQGLCSEYLALNNVNFEQVELIAEDERERVFRVTVKDNPHEELEVTLIAQWVVLDDDVLKFWVVADCQTTLMAEDDGEDSSDLKTELFNLALIQRFDYVPVFVEGEAPTESSEYLYYVFILNLDKWQAGQNYLTRDEVEEVITSHFEVTEVTHSSGGGWNWDAQSEIYTVAPSSCRTEPLYGVEEIKTYLENEKLIYDVTFKEYVFEEFAHGSIYDPIEIIPEYISSLSQPMQAVIAAYGEEIGAGELAVWEAIRAMIVAGETQEFEVAHTHHFKFYFDEQSEAIVFVSHDVIE